MPRGGKVAGELIGQNGNAGLRLQLLHWPSGVSPEESLVSWATTRPLPKRFSTTSGWLFRTRAMTCTLPSFGRQPIFLKRIVVVDHDERQETVAPAGEDLEERVRGHFHVGRIAAVHELGGQLERRGEEALPVVVKAIVVEAAVGIGADEERDATAVADVVFERCELIVGQPRHIEQADGRLLVELFGVG